MSAQIFQGDCREVMAGMDHESIDCVLTDPPYGLSFMGKDWDKGVPTNIYWMEALRVMKPGAHLLAFGGTRTFHRLTCAIEDAGFEIRDCMMWLYGSGFLKSHDVSKAIDKAAGAERETIGEGGQPCGGMGINAYGHWEKQTGNPITAPTTDAAKQWSGWGTALKPAWEPIIVARKPLEGTVAENVLKWGCGALNIDGGRIGTTEKWTRDRTDEESDKGETFENGFKNTVQQSNNLGRWPANVILDEEAGEMLDGQSGTLKSGLLAKHHKAKGSGGSSGFLGASMKRDAFFKDYGGDTGGASRFFYCAKASKRERNAGLEGMPESAFGAYGEFAGDGRGRQNEHQPAANTHPTVKPLSLLTYLLKLVCPPNGTVLDPFMGSGSTLVAAERLGFESIGIELENNYCEIARARLSNESFPLAVVV